MPEPSGVLPLAKQEYKLLEDLLFVMLGVDAIYIRAQPLPSPHAERSFMIDESADSSLKEMGKKILRLCSYRSTVVRFIEEKQERGQGMVNQAVAACMRELLEDYTILVVQLEHKLVSQGALTLHKCWYYVQPSLAYMAVLATCARVIWETISLMRIRNLIIVEQDKNFDADSVGAQSRPCMSTSLTNLQEL
ncbi:hypothetical protein MRX96_014549 [Rhipicephalus microplus]